MKTLSDGLGGDIDRGIVAGLEPDQVAGPYQSVPNMRLYPPAGLNIRTPDALTWSVIELPAAIPPNGKNLQIKIANMYGGGADLATILNLIQPALSGETTILWAACRAIGLKSTAGGAAAGVNKLQR